ncbi:MAG: redox-sensitive transcriptional activator SoxR [Pseudomonadota bacterium]
MATQPQFISIGQLAKRTGLAVSAIRYYETRGLVCPLRNAGGQRRFLRSDIRRLSFVLIAQRFGFSIDRIASVLSALPNRRAPTAQDWARIGAVFRNDLDARIAALEKFRDRLDGCIGCGCLSLDRCALYNPDDAARHKGAGPQFILGNRAKSSRS